MGVDVDKECIGGPASEDHDFGGGDVGEKEGHGGTGADGLVANFVGFKTKGGLAAKDGTGSADGLFGEGIGDEEGGVFKPNRVHGGGGGEVGNGAANALNNGSPALDRA